MFEVTRMAFVNSGGLCEIVVQKSNPKPHLKIEPELPQYLIILDSKRNKSIF